MTWSLTPRSLRKLRKNRKKSREKEERKRYEQKGENNLEKKKRKRTIERKLGKKAESCLPGEITSSEWHRIRASRVSIGRWQRNEILICADAHNRRGTGWLRARAFARPVARASFSNQGGWCSQNQRLANRIPAQFICTPVHASRFLVPRDRSWIALRVAHGTTSLLPVGVYGWRADTWEIVDDYKYRPTSIIALIASTCAMKN